MSQRQKFKGFELNDYFPHGNKNNYNHQNQAIKQQTRANYEVIDKNELGATQPQFVIKVPKVVQQYQEIVQKVDQINKIDEIMQPNNEDLYKNIQQSYQNNEHQQQMQDKSLQNYTQNDQNIEDDQNDEDSQDLSLNMIPNDLLQEVNGSDYLGQACPKKSKITLQLKYIQGVIEIGISKIYLELVNSVACTSQYNGTTRQVKTNEERCLIFTCACKHEIRFQRNRVQSIDQTVSQKTKDVVLAYFETSHKFLIKQILCYVVCNCNTSYSSYLELNLQQQGQESTYKVQGGDFHYQCQKCSNESYVIPKICLVDLK